MRAGDAVGAGELNHRIEIGRYADGVDQWGDPLPREWQLTAQVWASVKALTGRLYFQAQQTAAQSDHEVTIRWRADVEPGMIVRDGGRELTIQVPLDQDGRRRWLQLLCREERPA